MLGYVISFLTGALLGYLGNRLFDKRGWGYTTNIIVGGLAGVFGNWYLVQYFHSIEHPLLRFVVTAAISSITLLSIIFFVYSYTKDEEY